MHIVAITGLTTAPDAAAAALARALGTLPYDERRKLAGGLPAVVLAAASAHGRQIQVRPPSRLMITWPVVTQWPQPVRCDQRTLRRPAAAVMAGRPVRR